MATETDSLIPEPEVKLIAGPELWSLEFRRSVGPAESAESPEPVQAQIRFNLSITRFINHRLGVELATDIDNLPQLKIHAAFRAVFMIDAGPGAIPDEDRIWRRVGALIAPGMLYPFIREAISSSAQKAGLHRIMTPLIKFSDVFDPDTINLPPDPGTVAESAQSTPPA